ncbi:hypothetical protein K504DRAFT_507401 [Pleomassaria siparia CBS 279.74]|uniref:Uncharacterized protein n=1 Tax=Pleomassaria siparia CBS 279.74 TaxID=1314801 RepID=A0A6G1JTK8_9PLEO|nr:hypothetical protein K504DRAFT_507401 [Pleomassaria siparia CBS 279.74]
MYTFGFHGLGVCYDAGHRGKNSLGKTCLDGLRQPVPQGKDSGMVVHADGGTFSSMSLAASACSSFGSPLLLSNPLHTSHGTNMSPQPIALTSNFPKSLFYTPTPFAYTDDDDNALANNLLCPRYAENDSSSAPPSPASIESFDILDSVAWRQGHSSYNSRGGQVRACAILGSRWRDNKARILWILLLMVLLAAGGVVAGMSAWRHQRASARDECVRREGGERCREITWAKCVAVNGVGYCEGIYGVTGK